MRWEEKYAQEIFLVHSLGNCGGPAAAGNASWAASSEPPLRLLSSVPIPVAPAIRRRNVLFRHQLCRPGDRRLLSRRSVQQGRGQCHRQVDRHADRPEQRPRAVRGDFAAVPSRPGPTMRRSQWRRGRIPIALCDRRPEPRVSVSTSGSTRPDRQRVHNESPGEPTRADELAYDPKDGLILAINNAASPPFGTLVKVNKTTGALDLRERI